MKTISQYQEDIKALQKKLGDINANAANKGRDLTDDELNIKDEIMDMIEEYQRIIANLRRQERIESTLTDPPPAQTVQRRQTVETPNRDDRKDRFMTFGEQLIAVLNAGRPGGSIDPRLYNAATGLNETVASDGGLRAYA